MTNPYLDAYRTALDHQRRCDPRQPTTQPHAACMGDSCRGWARAHGFEAPRRRWAWAVPDQRALDAIAEHSPRGVVEIGAGAGYWAWLLCTRGVDTVAYDPDPTGAHGWHDGHQWSPVQLGDHADVSAHPGRTLLLCWPQRDWAEKAVALLHHGDTIVYVGRRLDRPAQLTDPIGVVAIPQWAGSDDQLEIYRQEARP